MKRKKKTRRHPSQEKREERGKERETEAGEEAMVGGETDLDRLEEVGPLSLAHGVSLKLQSIKQPDGSHFGHVAEIHLLPLLLHFLDL